MSVKYWCIAILGILFLCAAYAYCQAVEDGRTGLNDIILVQNLPSGTTRNAAILAAKTELISEQGVVAAKVLTLLRNYLTVVIGPQTAHAAAAETACQAEGDARIALDRTYATFGNCLTQYNLWQAEQ